MKIMYVSRKYVYILHRHRYSISSTAINILVRYLTLKHRDFEHKLGSSVNRSIEAHTFAILCKENNIK